eukprot:6189522-Pleurochrysis_carterae.AAC.1
MIEAVRQTANVNLHMHASTHLAIQALKVFLHYLHQNSSATTNKTKGLPCMNSAATSITACLAYSICFKSHLQIFGKGMTGR